MNLDIRRHGIEIDEDARARLERRLEFALGRFSHRLERVTIAIANQLGSRDGSDKVCRMLVRLQRAGEEERTEAIAEQRRSGIGLHARDGHAGHRITSWPGRGA